MKERPILFSGDMVRAILDGRKTQTRRVVKLPERLLADGENPVDIDMCLNVSGHWSAFDRGNNPAKAWEMIKCPYGKPGDRLWVRETFCVWMNAIQGSNGYIPPEAVTYPPHVVIDEVKRPIDYRADFPKMFAKWKPSIFMPRSASRISLEIKSIGVERLHHISPKDIQAEGYPKHVVWQTFVKCYRDKDERYAKLRDLWQEGWNKINGKKYPWESNPWVWVVEFKKTGPAL
jgi:hypothetical protein